MTPLLPPSSGWNNGAESSSLFNPSALNTCQCTLVTTASDISLVILSCFPLLAWFLSLLALPASFPTQKQWGATKSDLTKEKEDRLEQLHRSKASAEVDNSHCIHSTLDATHVTAKLGDRDTPASGQLVSPRTVEHGTKNVVQGNAGCSSNEPVILSSCNDNSNTNEGATVEGNSRLTSRDGSDSKMPPRVEEKRADAFVIDFNVIPESESEEHLAIDVSENVHHSTLTGNDIVTCDKSARGEVLELFKTASEGIGTTRLSSRSQSPKRASASMEIDGNRLHCQDARHISDLDLARKRNYLQGFKGVYFQDNGLV